MTDSALARLRELARQQAEWQHRFGPEHRKHIGRFDQCPHDDCMLVRAEPPAEGWRPIATANQKDRLWLWDGHEQYAGSFNHYYASFGRHDGWLGWLAATHWMYLPLPPAPPEGSR